MAVKKTENRNVWENNLRLLVAIMAPEKSTADPHFHTRAHNQPPTNQYPLGSFETTTFRIINELISLIQVFFKLIRTIN